MYLELKYCNNDRFKLEEGIILTFNISNKNRIMVVAKYSRNVVQLDQYPTVDMFYLQYTFMIFVFSRYPFYL